MNYRMQGNDILDPYGNRLVEIRASEIYDPYGTKIGEVRGDEICDAYGVRIGLMQGPWLYDASGLQIAHVDDIRRLFDQGHGGTTLAAVWLLRIR
jgi:hypothetical protein